MSSPSSYEFYHRSNVLRERKEGTQLYRVFITDKKITVYCKTIIRTSKSQVLFEKIVEQKTFSLHKNHKGELYLKSFNRSAGGSITDMSLSLALNKRPRNTNNLLPSSMPDDCKLLVEKTILAWFGYEHSAETLYQMQDRLLFPAFKDETFPRGLGTDLALSELQKVTSRVTKTLRESSSWNEFVMNFCPTAHTLNDVAIINDNYPSKMLPIAVMELPPMSALFPTYGDTLQHIVDTFNKMDVSLLAFMFRNLPPNDRIVGLETMLSLTNFHLQNFKGNGFYQYSSHESIENSLNKVPAKLRPELARQLLKTLVGTDAHIKDTGLASFKDTYLVTYLTNAFRHWFAQEVLESQLKTVAQIEDLDNRFMELFGVSFPKTSPIIKFHEIVGTEETEDLEFYSINTGQLLVQNPEYHYDMLGSLMSLGAPVPQRGLYGVMNGYIGEDGTFVPVSGDLHSIDDIMDMVESGTKTVDSHLARIGRAVTPENRRAFLGFRHKERKFKNSWKYYDLGVTDVKKILAFKKAKITSKRDILTYKELPDEMFYELTAMAAGVEDMEMTDAS